MASHKTLKPVNILRGVWVLVRPANLLILLLTLYMLHPLAFSRMYFPREVAFGMPPLYFWLFVVATLLAAAAGNIRNDIEDEAIDNINRPAKKVLGDLISLPLASRISNIFFVVGILIALFLSLQSGNTSLFGLYVLAAAILYGYSALLKPIPFVGNFLIALLTSLVILSLWLFDIAFSVKLDVYEILPGRRIMYISLFYAGFAFLLSLIREIVKDMADQEGDRSHGRRTLAIIWPVLRIKMMIILLLLGLFASVSSFQYWLMSEGFRASAVALLAVHALSIAAIVKTLGADEKQDYDRLSGWLKLIMLTGIASGYLFWLN